MNINQSINQSIPPPPSPHQRTHKHTNTQARTRSLRLLIGLELHIKTKWFLAVKLTLMTAVNSLWSSSRLYNGNSADLCLLVVNWMIYCQSAKQHLSHTLSSMCISAPWFNRYVTISGSPMRTANSKAVQPNSCERVHRNGQTTKCRNCKCSWTVCLVGIIVLGSNCVFLWTMWASTSCWPSCVGTGDRISTAACYLASLTRLLHWSNMFLQISLDTDPPVFEFTGGTVPHVLNVGFLSQYRSHT